VTRLLPLAAFALACASCSNVQFAFQNPRNRPLMNRCEKYLVPESRAARIATAPLTLPTCLVAGVADTLLIHPVMEFDDAWHDTARIAWRPTGRGYVTECSIFPLRAIATPPFYGYLWLTRVVFDVRPTAPDPKQLAKQLLSPDPQNRMLAIEVIQPYSYKGEQAEPATGAMLAACRKWPDDKAFLKAVYQRLPEPLTAGARDYLVTAATSGDLETQFAAKQRLFKDCRFDRERGRKAENYHDSVNALAEVYNRYVQQKRHPAEVQLALQVGEHVNEPGPQALAMYITRSLAKRGWPDYAEAAAFHLQTGLLYYTTEARVDAIDYEWRALRLLPNWPQWVVWALNRRARSGKSGRESLLRLQDEVIEKLRNPVPSKAADVQQLTRELLQIKTALDAEEIAARLLDGPKSDRDLFVQSVRILNMKRQR
jgi:hypothetical protein